MNDLKITNVQEPLKISLHIPKFIFFQMNICKYKFEKCKIKKLCQSMNENTNLQNNVAKSTRVVIFKFVFFFSYLLVEDATQWGNNI